MGPSAARLRLALLLLVVPAHVAASCDMHGLCAKLVRLSASERSLCNSDEDCLRPREPDCMNDGALSNEFSCEGTDCIVVQSMARTLADCAESFPSTRGTNLEEHSDHELADEFAADALARDEPSQDKPVEKDGLLVFHSTDKKKKRLLV